MSNELKHYIIDPASNFGKLDSTYQLINYAKRREEIRDLELLKQKETNDVELNKNKKNRTSNDLDTSSVDEGYKKKSIECEANLNVNEKLILDTNNNPYVKLKRINVEEFCVEENVDSPEEEDDDDDSNGNATGSGSGKRYPMSFKIEVGKFMANHTETEASKKFGIPRATAWRWKKFKSRSDIKDPKRRTKKSPIERKHKFYSESFKSVVMNYLMTHNDLEARGQFPGVPEGTLRYWKKKITLEAKNAEISSLMVRLLDEVIGEIVEKAKSQFPGISEGTLNDSGSKITLEINDADISSLIAQLLDGLVDEILEKAQK